MKTTTPAWLIVALREVETKLRDKAFIISTIGTLLVIIGSIVVSSILGSRTAEFAVAATDESSYEVLDQVQKDKPGDMRLSIAKATEPEARQQLADGELDAMLSSSNGSQEYSLTGYDGVDEQLSQLVADGVDTVLTDRVLSSAGLDATSLPAADALAVSQLQGDADRNSMVKAMGFLFSFLFYMAALLFGMPIANSVIEEKQNRVVEILASTIRLRQLLTGKIIGNVILAMIQLLVFLGVGLLAAYLSPLEIPFLGVVSQVAGWFVVFFFGGFLVLAGAWAALGSLATRTEDLQQSSGPVVTVLIAVLFIGLYAKDGFLVAASYVPIASSVAMPIRLLSGEVALWEPILSLAVLLATCWVVLLFAEKIYRRAVMHTGGSLTLRKALKLEV
ncbi:ABC transporter permease [Glutamicibacter halophytocola]|uniref:ABC transporter permease n=1 Tax=Glutamicibacter halophytocola TaxID=1933880 RepID=A0ABX5Y963_9MICC|nr:MULTISPECIES: ABC transporter permease [Glutamicibacter]MBF6670901.1 ABC transporter permease [Glutamicibacter sp. FBE19]NQD41353.1 ABC transporter permease [Glutamicibacter halophytocola]QDY66209.1 ABC transporter permease [Glutamicibacter halophytocola]